MAILNTQFEQNINQNDKISGNDSKIINYINDNPDGDFSNVIRQDNDWPVFFQLSEMRWGLYSWYDFGENTRLLEIGAGFGALTGLFCKKCKSVVATERSKVRAEALVNRFKNVQNLEVYVGDVLSMEFTDKFDVIVLTGILERQGRGTSEREVYSGYLQQLKALLAPKGRLLLAVENRFGLKYMCGAEEPHTGRPFDGLNHYPFGTGGYSFSREELADILVRSGLNSCKFYYPLPDYKIPQVIYSQNYLPQTKIGERLVPYYVKRDSLIAIETDLYDDIVENGVFEFFANSFLVECSVDATSCLVDFATVTLDRGHERGTITAIRNDNIVIKQAIFPEGKKNIHRLFSNMRALQERRVPVVAIHMEKDTAVMPVREEPLASAFLKQAVSDKTIDLYDYFERLYAYIMKSSDPVDSKRNAFLLQWPGEAYDSLDFGVILSRAYIEMIPMNAFWVNNDFVFFDQEFVCDNYPAGYVLFRALKNTYIFIPEAERLVTLHDMKKHFNLEQVWDVYEKQDEQFLIQVRRLKENRTFYNWNQIDRERIYKKAELLNHKDEIIADYKVSDKMKRIWAVQLGLLDIIKRVCEDNGLRFYIIRGTLLGAVRHKGFIPWDDDIDIALPRADYDKLLKLPGQVFGEDVFLQTAENDTECFFGAFARLRDCRSTAIDLKNWGRSCNQGIWIDVFPLDAYDISEKFRKRQRKKIARLYELLYAKTYGKQMCGFGELSKQKWAWRRLVARFKHKQTLISQLNDCCSCSKNKSQEFIGIQTHYKETKVFYKEDFKDVVHLTFEDRILPAPKGYQRCLEMTVSKNFMVYPPQEERKPHHHELFIPELSFDKFNQRYVHSFRDVEGKDIILFGAGLMVEDYMKKFGDKYRPVFLVDNNPEKWGTKKCGIEVRNPKELLKIPPERRKLFLCNVYYKQIEQQLIDMGITEYCIYVQNRNWIIEDENKVK